VRQYYAKHTGEKFLICPQKWLYLITWGRYSGRNQARACARQM